MHREFSLWKRSRKMPWLPLVMVLSVIAGCRQDWSNVRGRVTLDGEPLTNTVIYFEPTKGPLAQSSLDDNGEYCLQIPGTGVGTTPGKYRVYLAAMPSEQEEMAKVSISESDLVAGRPWQPHATPTVPHQVNKYYSAATTDWHRDVEPGSNKIDFELVTN